MPLSAPAERELLHLRDITIRGYHRKDGMFDVEAHLVDTKTYDFGPTDRGMVPPGQPLHGMHIRLTVDSALLIHSCEASSDYTPYTVCPQAAPNFSRLAGLTIGAGFNRAVHERVGGIHGCTHLREVLAQMATVAYQTLTVLRRTPEAMAAAAADPRKPPQLGTCLAYAPDSALVAKRWPAWVAAQRPG